MKTLIKGRSTMTFQSVPGILVAALLTVLAPNIAHANIITNPGFETGDFTGWTQFGNVGFTGVDGSPHSGSFAAFLGPVGSLGFLSQTLATTPGIRYDLSFFLRSDGGTPNEFQVSWNGSVISDQMNLPAFGYTERDFPNILATSSTTPLVFGFRDDPGFLFLDDVAVNPTPEPTTLILLGTTMAGLGLAWRRRHKQN
jgi:hypothetical protein